MLEIRIHGRGGQGNVLAAYLLATAAIEAGRWAQAFPAFGAERRGAPVQAFVRIADGPIKNRSQVRTPRFLIIQDESLLHEPELLAGLSCPGGIVINAARLPADLSDEASRRVLALPATELAQRVLGRPVPNVPLLAAFLSVTGLLGMEALQKALRARFSGPVLEKNLALVGEATALAPAGAWEDMSHASA